MQGALTAVGVAAAGMAVAIGVEAVNKASAFQNAMLQNVAHAGLAKNQFDAVSKSVLAMSTDVGQMPTDLAQGLYPILSGFSGITDQSAKAKSSLEALRLAAEDVVGTETKTTVTSGALVSAFNALGLQTNDTATNISRLNTLNDQMEATVIAGNMHWDQYANVVGKLATAIKGTSVRWVEASSALATMTNEGFTAQRSQTYLANLFTQMELKTDSLAKNAAKLGGAYTYVSNTTKTLAGHTVIWHGLIGHTADRIEHLSKTVHATMGIGFDEAKFKTMSLAQQLQYLTDITHGNQSELLKLFNNNATALKTYNALESGMKSYKSNLDAIKNSHGATASAFQTASSSFDAAKNRMKAAIDVLLIDLGTQLLPVLSKVLDWVTPLVKRFADWIVNSRDLHTWISNVGTFLQYTFLPAVQNIAGAVQTFIGWLQQGSAPAQALELLLGGIVTLNVAKSIGDAATSVIGLGKNVAGFLANDGAKLLNYFSPNGLAAQVGSSSSLIEGDLATVGASADTAAGNVAMVGSAAEADAVETTGAAATMEGAFGGMLGIIADVTGAIKGLLGPIGGLLLAFSTVPDTVKSMGDQGMLKNQWWNNLPGSDNTKNVIDPRILAHNPNYGKTPPTPVIPGSPYGTYYPAPYPGHPGRPGFASGVTNFSGGLAYVHQGEVLSNLAPGTNVTPASRVSLGGGPNITINVSTMAGSRAEITRMVDLLEREMASRFRGQTSYGFGGVV